MRKLRVTSQFQKDWEDVPNEIREVAHSATELLKVNPVDSRYRVKKLQGIVPSVWRVRIGSYRLVYSFSKTELVLHRIRLRKDVYKNIS